MNASEAEQGGLATTILPNREEVETMWAQTVMREPTNAASMYDRIVRFAFSAPVLLAPRPSRLRKIFRPL